MFMLWDDAVRSANAVARLVPANRAQRREELRAAKGKPSKGTPKDKRLKRNRRRK